MLYHFPGPVVDALRYVDFLSYIRGIDAWREYKKKNANADPFGG